MLCRQGASPARLSHDRESSRRIAKHYRLDFGSWNQAVRISPSDRDRVASSSGDVGVAPALTSAPQKLRIGMLGLYGMPGPKLQFTGFETGFGEIAPRLAEA